MRVYVGHVSGVFDASYWSAGFGTFFQVSPHASRWQEDCTPTPEENDQYTANHF
jgi:hypothetical protein